MSVNAGEEFLDRAVIGESVCVNGVCLTVVTVEGAGFSADISRETLACTTLGGLQPGSAVNLERSLTPDSRIGGHFVSGHVDALGTVQQLVQAARSCVVTIGLPQVLAPLVAAKGSVTVDGVSLTVNAVSADAFEINLIPHTQAVTTLGRLELGQRVNLEADMLARYVARLRQFEPAAQNDGLQ